MDIIILFGYFWTIVIYLFNIIVLAAQAKRSYRLNHKESFYSLCLCIGTLITGAIVLLTYGSFDVHLSLIIVLCAGILFSFFGVSNLIHFLLERRKAPSKKEIDFTERESVRHELIRKIFHIVLFFGIITLLVVGFMIVEQLFLQGAEIINLDEMYYEYWGSLDGLNMHLLRAPDIGQGMIMLFFFLLTTIFIMNEGARVGKWYYFPLKKLAALGIREKEKETIASYVYFTLGMVFASIFLYPIPLFSIIGILCFADTAASLFGRRYGKHKLQFNKTKSWEGAVGGFIVCYIVTFLFVGPIWGLAASIVFLAIDLITPIVPISDNIAIPIGVTGIYLLLSFLQIPMYLIVFAGL